MKWHDWLVVAVLVAIVAVSLGKFHQVKGRTEVEVARKATVYIARDDKNQVLPEGWTLYTYGGEGLNRLSSPEDNGDYFCVDVKVLVELAWRLHDETESGL